MIDGRIVAGYGVLLALVLSLLGNVYLYSRVVSNNDKIEIATERKKNNDLEYENHINGLANDALGSEFSRVFPNADSSGWFLCENPCDGWQPSYFDETSIAGGQESERGL